jgi:GNAT superfamily N-acetyltransferase
MEDLPAVFDFCDRNDVELLIARCAVEDIEVAQALESAGAQLMDTLIYYSRDLTKSPVPQESASVVIRPLQPGDEVAVGDVAAASFKNYSGHYHADSRLDRAKCDEAYTSWAVRSCLSREIAAEVFLAEFDGRPAGFATLRVNSAEEGEVVLNAVAPFAQRYGIYRHLVITAMNWCLSWGANRVLISTQITNIAVQKVWVRLGFEPKRAYYTFHRWMDR